MEVISELFSPIYGKFCWNARKGYGSFLTFEFGAPHVNLTGPTQRRPNRRATHVHGDWHLWIYMCDWTIYLDGIEAATSSSFTKPIRKAVLALDGQILEQVTVDDSMATAFDFDLGGRLETYPNPDEYGSDAKLWHLYQPTGMVFTLRADGVYTQHGSVERDEKVWLPLMTGNGDQQQ